MQPEKCGRMPACVLEGSVSAAREVWADVWSYACVLNFMAKGCICIKGSCSSFLQEHFEELLEFMSRYIPLQLCIISLEWCMLCYTSLIPRPSPAPVFDFIPSQHAPPLMHPHTCTLTHAPSHIHPHTCTHTCTLTRAPSHVHPHSGPCMTLALTKGDTGEGVVEDLREFLGPPDVEQAKQDAPER